MKSISTVLLIFLTLSFAQNSFAQKSFRLGFVEKYDFSGDSIWLANTKKKDRVDSKSIAIFSYNTLGTININGFDLGLKLIKHNLPDKNFKVGRGGYQLWNGKNTTVRLDYIFTWLCQKDQENCSVYYYKGFLEIKYDGKRRKVNVVGSGGS